MSPLSLPVLAGAAPIVTAPAVWRAWSRAPPPVRVALALPGQRAAVLGRAGPGRDAGRPAAAARGGRGRGPAGPQPRRCRRLRSGRGGSTRRCSPRSLCASTIPVTTATPPSSATASRRSMEPHPAQRADPGNRLGMATMVTVVARRWRSAGEPPRTAPPCPARRSSPGAPTRGDVLLEGAEQGHLLGEQLGGERRPGWTRFSASAATKNDQTIRAAGPGRRRRARRRGSTSPSRRRAEAGGDADRVEGRAVDHPVAAARPTMASARPAHIRLRTCSFCTKRAQTATRIRAWYSSSRAIPTGSRSIATK